jgi:glycerol-3-phosphate acyltransferase PlsY
MGAGIATFVCDGLKTAAAMLLGRLIGGEYGFLIAGGMCLIGHCFPVYFGFKGGKGVTVGAVIGLMLSWKMFLILLAVFIVTVVITKRVSAASLACAVAFPISEYIVGQRGVYQMILGFVAMICVIVMHRENIKRLINGTEPVFKAGKKK